MKNKIVTIVLSVILFIVPALIAPQIWCNYNIPKIIVLLICGLILLVITLLRIEELKFDKQDILICAFGILAILSTIFSKNVTTSFFGEENRYEGILTIITYILIYYNAKYYFKNYKNFLYIGTIIYILICIFSIIQFYVGNNIIFSPIFGKGANGTFGNVNFAGSFISIILPAFIIGYILRNRKIYLIGSIAGFSSMVMCITRSSWVAFFIYMLIITIYLIKNKNKKYFKRFIIIAIAFSICFIGIKSIDKNKQIFNKVNATKAEIENLFEANTNGTEEDSSKLLSKEEKTKILDKLASGRVGIWKLTSKIIYKTPILGCGVDAIKDGLEKLCPMDNINYILDNNMYIDKAHNEYLQIAATMGIPAIIIYLIFISTIEISCMKKMLKHKVIAIYFIIITSYLTQAFFNISTIGVAPIFWFILGMASRNINRNKTSTS